MCVCVYKLCVCEDVCDSVCVCVRAFKSARDVFLLQCLLIALTASWVRGTMMMSRAQSGISSLSTLV